MADSIPLSYHDIKYRQRINQARLDSEITAQIKAALGNAVELPAGTTLTFREYQPVTGKRSGKATTSQAINQLIADYQARVNALQSSREGSVMATQKNVGYPVDGFTNLKCAEHDPDGISSIACPDIIAEWNGNTMREVYASFVSIDETGAKAGVVPLFGVKTAVQMNLVNNDQVYGVVLLSGDIMRISNQDLGFTLKDTDFVSMADQAEFILEDMAIDFEPKCNTSDHWRYSSSKHLTSPQDCLAWMRSGMCTACTTALELAKVASQAHTGDMLKQPPANPNGAMRGADALNSLNAAANNVRTLSAPSGKIEGKPMQRQPGETFHAFRLREAAAGLKVEPPKNAAEFIQAGSVDREEDAKRLGE